MCLSMAAFRAIVVRILTSCRSREELIASFVVQEQQFSCGNPEHVLQYDLVQLQYIVPGKYHSKLRRYKDKGVLNRPNRPNINIQSSTRSAGHRQTRRVCAARGRMFTGELEGRDVTALALRRRFLFTLLARGARGACVSPHRTRRAGNRSAVGRYCVTLRRTTG